MTRDDSQLTFACPACGFDVDVPTESGWPTPTYEMKCPKCAGRIMRTPEDVVGCRVRALRFAMGWTLDDLAGRAGLHKTYVGRLERGEQSPTIRTIVHIAAATNQDPAVLLEGLIRSPATPRSRKRGQKTASA